MNSRRRLGIYSAATLGLLTLVGVAANAEPLPPGGPRAPQPRDVLPIEGGLDAIRSPELDAQAERVADAVILPEWLAITLAVVLGVGLIYLLSRDRFRLSFRRPSLQRVATSTSISEEEEAEEIAEAASDLIAELNAGDSPRYAIQRAYAVVEGGFGAPELARKPAETPLRYLERIFGRHKQVEAPLASLTALFQQARFSDDPVDEPMRADAIAALTDIRDYYTAVAWRRIENSRSQQKKRRATVGTSP